MEASIYTIITGIFSCFIIATSFGKEALFDRRRKFWSRIRPRGYLLIVATVGTNVCSVLKEVEEKKEEKRSQVAAEIRTSRAVKDITGTYFNQLIADGKTKHQADSIINAAQQDELRTELAMLKRGSKSPVIIELTYSRDSITFGKNKFVMSLVSQKGSIKNIKLYCSLAAYQSGELFLIENKGLAFDTDEIVPEAQGLTTAIITDRLYLLDMFVVNVYGSYLDLNTNKTQYLNTYYKLNVKTNIPGPPTTAEKKILETFFKVGQPLEVSLGVPGKE